ncbi:MAG: hypothetical protein OEY49_08585 [Candidatus Heimdallarchaeota archaeon]|nr:hypothetical protein [Candidatus Heimdallarchaeota archaeon]
MTKDSIDFKDVLEQLTLVAKEDGKVTSEEEDFLEKLRQDIEKYEKSVKQAKEDDFISDDEFHDLVLVRDQILANAINHESRSEDINNLIKKLYDLINQIIIPGMAEDELIDDED